MRFKIDWASLIFGSNLPFLLCFTLYFEGNFPSTSPRVAYIWRGDWVVTKISSCRVNTTSRRRIKRLGISCGSIFLLFSNKSSWGPLS